MKGIKGNRLVTALLLALLLVPLSAQSAAPRLDPEPYYQSVGSLTEPLGLSDFAKLSLLASGSPESSLSDLESRLMNLATGAVEATSSIQGEYAKGEALLSYLHSKVLKRYEEFQTRVDVALDTGSYNCVSSSVLYMLVAKAAGMRVWGVQTTDHAFCAVATERGDIDIETTNKFGFDPGTKKEFLDSFGNSTGFSYVSPRNYSLRNKLGERLLVSLIMSNRTVILERSLKYAESVPIAVDLHAMTGGIEDPSYLPDRIVNYAGVLFNAGKVAEAIDFIDQATLRVGKSARIASFYAKAVPVLAYDFLQRGDIDGARKLIGDRYARGDIDLKTRDQALADLARNLDAKSASQVQELEKKGDYRGAMALARELHDKGLLSDAVFKQLSGEIAGNLEATVANQAQAREVAKDFSGAQAILDKAYKEGDIGEKLYLELSKEIANNKIVASLDTLSFEEAMALVRESYDKGLISKAKYAEYSIYLYEVRASKLAKEGKYLEAADSLAPAISEFPTDSSLVRARDACLANYANQTHKTALELMKSKKYAEARELLLAALKRVPNNALLKADLKTAESAL